MTKDWRTRGRAFFLCEVTRIPIMRLICRIAFFTRSPCPGGRGVCYCLKATGPRKKSGCGMPIPAWGKMRGDVKCPLIGPNSPILSPFSGRRRVEGGGLGRCSAKRGGNRWHGPGRSGEGGCGAGFRYPPPSSKGESIWTGVGRKGGDKLSTALLAVVKRSNKLLLLMWTWDLPPPSPSLGWVCDF